MAEERTAQEARPSGHGLDLDLRRLDEVTAAERKGLDDHYIRSRGAPHPHNFWLQQDKPGVYKRFCVIMDTIPAGAAGPRPEQHTDSFYATYGIGSLVWYAMQGHLDGLRSGVHRMLKGGLTRSQALEVLAFIFLCVGPRSMELIVDASVGMDWSVSGPPAKFPPGWKAEPNAFKAGLDFTSPKLSDAELGKLRNWHMDNEGEVPEYVDFMARYRPDVLKAYRNRWEHIFVELPKQFMPYLMIRVEGQRGFTPGVREGVLLGKHWGLTRDEVIEMLAWTGFLYGSPGALSLAVREVGDLIDQW